MPKMIETRYLLTQTIIHNPVSTSFFHCTLCRILKKDKNKDVGTGLCMIVCLCSILFLSFLAWWHPYIPLHFEEMIFTLVSLIFCRSRGRAQHIWERRNCAAVEGKPNQKWWNVGSFARSRASATPQPFPLRIAQVRTRIHVPARLA